MNVIFFDTETTGTDTAKDKIVSIAALKMDPEFNELEPMKEILLYPGIPIPPEATAVHGITDGMVARAPRFGQIAKSLFAFLEGCALGGFNVVDFDIPLLSEEFAREGIEWPAPGTLIVDSFRVYREKEKRDLTAAVKFYLNEDHGSAHNAGADVTASWRVLAAQVGKYEDLAGMTFQELHSFCVGKDAVDLAGKLARNEAGEIVYSFGKDKGKSVIAFPGFAHWMLKPEQSFPPETKRILRQILHNKLF